MRVDIVTREFPPHVYGGAGVHVAELSRNLAARMDVRVRCFGPADDYADEPLATGYPEPAGLAAGNGALRTLGTDLAMVEDIGGADLVHSHTWYANMAGHWAHLYHDIPHVLSAHSLEPLRPWKAEQLGGGYALSSWAERTAYEGAAAVIAVSHGMRRDILRCYPFLDPERVQVIHNGIDASLWRPDPQTAALGEHGIDPGKRSIVFVGRITRQKGLPYLLRAIRHVDPEVQVVLCAGAPDTPEIAAEVSGLVAELQGRRPGVFWIERMLPRDELVQILSHATAFVCPSVYEPLGIVNLEAMACGAPVVGTATGGIPEVVADGETGLLVPIEQAQDGTGTPVDGEAFVRDLAARLNEIVADPDRAARMGQAGMARARSEFSWERIAARTQELYERVLHTG